MPTRALSPCSGPRGGECTALIAAVGVCAFVAARAYRSRRRWVVEVACCARTALASWWVRSRARRGSSRYCMGGPNLPERRTKRRWEGDPSARAARGGCPHRGTRHGHCGSAIAHRSPCLLATSYPGGQKGVSDSVSGRISRSPYQAAYETDMSQIRVSYGADTSVS